MKLAILPLVLAVCCGAASVPERLFPSLKVASAPRYFGAALAESHLRNTSDRSFARLAAAEFSGATPENEMKWEIVHPQRGVYNFSAGNFIASFARRNRQTLRCHTLVWHSQLAPYVANLTAPAIRREMLEHIERVAGHFKNDCYSWDVVNEPFNEDGTFRDSPFLTAFGEDYIEIALRKARQVAPRAKLYVNDFNVEGVNAKSNAMFNLFKKLKQKKLIDGVGLESHFTVNQIPPDLRQNMQRFAQLGVDVAITELDIRGNVPLSPQNRTNQAAQFASVVRDCVSVRRCVGITTWGITDKYSWIPGFFDGQGEALLWDDRYNKKRSYFATIEALRAH